MLCCSSAWPGVKAAHFAGGNHRIPEWLRLEGTICLCALPWARALSSRLGCSEYHSSPGHQFEMLIDLGGVLMNLCWCWGLLARGHCAGEIALGELMDEGPECRA